MLLSIEDSILLIILLHWSQFMKTLECSSLNEDSVHIIAYMYVVMSEPTNNHRILKTGFS
jgi:hypothetical protein